MQIEQQLIWLWTMATQSHRKYLWWPLCSTTGSLSRLKAEISIEGFSESGYLTPPTQHQIWWRYKQELIWRTEKLYSRRRIEVSCTLRWGDPWTGWSTSTRSSGTQCRTCLGRSWSFVQPAKERTTVDHDSVSRVFLHVWLHIWNLRTRSWKLTMKRLGT